MMTTLGSAGAEVARLQLASVHDKTQDTIAPGGFSGLLLG